MSLVANDIERSARKWMDAWHRTSMVLARQVLYSEECLAPLGVAHEQWVQQLRRRFVRANKRYEEANARWCKARDDRRRRTSMVVRMDGAA
jgi:hypothetical protein